MLGAAEEDIARMYQPYKGMDGQMDGQDIMKDKENKRRNGNKGEGRRKMKRCENDTAEKGIFYATMYRNQRKQAG